ncbi:hypothetical protein DL95DRAFT_411993 [Leptodontidium sp. 2 PMI_412]|nr:hypothetical protein DL95DRAFT_411993 [Leptodontidium sp. 2 PMI_412]
MEMVKQVDPGAAPKVADINSQASSDRPTMLVHSTTTDSFPKMLEDSSPPPPESKTFGMKKKVFWILTLLTLIIISATLAGIIGGLLSKRSKASSSTTKKSPKCSSYPKPKKTATNPGAPKSSTATVSTPPPSNIDMCSMSFCQGDHQLSWWGSRRVWEFVDVDDGDDDERWAGVGYCEADREIELMMKRNCIPVDGLLKFSQGWHRWRTKKLEGQRGQLL